MKDKKASLRHFSELLEHIGGKLDEFFDHHFVDAFVAESHDAGLQSAAPVVQQNLSLVTVHGAISAQLLV